MWPGPDRPYQELPPLPPAQDVETREVLKAVIRARSALAALDQACRRLPEPGMLINLLPILEAQASSEIENIVTTNDELFRAAGGALDGATTPAIKEALRYRQALHAGSALVGERPVTTQTAEEICSIIQGRSAVLRNQPGTYIGNPITHERIYTPPEGQDVIRTHLSRWERFLHDDHGFDPLVAMAMQHYQFEAIHPFFDGNGRTGRIVNLLYLIEHELLRWPVLYLSGHIVRTKDEYCDALRAVTADGAWSRWVLYIVGAVETTSVWTLELIERIEVLRSSVEGAVRRALPSQVPVLELVQVLFTQPYVRIDTVVEAGLAQRQTASRWLAVLCDAGVLGRQKNGRLSCTSTRRSSTSSRAQPTPERCAAGLIGHDMVMGSPC